MNQEETKTEQNSIFTEVLPKREARESAFILVFEKLFNDELSFDQLLELAEESAVFRIDGFAKNLVVSTFDNLEEIDSLISDNLVNWSFDRLSSVSKSLLRLGVAELKYKRTETNVIFNEYVELSKKYSNLKEASFINGVLASVAKKVRA